MIKLAPHHPPVHKPPHSGKKEMLIAFSLFVGSLSFLVYSYCNHEAANLLCRCILCTLNRIPQDGECLYNGYLLLISIAWGTLILGFVCVAFYCRNKKK